MKGDDDMKKIIILSLIMSLLAVSCASNNSASNENENETTQHSENTESTYTTTVTSASETTSEDPALPVEPCETQRLTDKNYTDYSFSASIRAYNNETAAQTNYYGELTDENTVAQLWNYIAAVENQPPCEFDENDSIGYSGSALLTLNDNQTGCEYTISEGIFYENPEDDGGANIIIINGVTYDSKDYACYYETYVDGESLFGDKLWSVLYDELVEDENTVQQTAYERRESKSGIVVINSYRNFAWGHQHYGSFIDFEGNEYTFDFSEDYITSEEEFIQKLNEYYTELADKPVKRYGDKERILRIALLADAVDEDAVIVSEHNAYDAGQQTLYILNDEQKLVKISSYGDFIETNTDENALQIAGLFKKLS